MVLCQRCGKENELGSKFCIFCGGEIREDQKTGKKCPKCSAVNPDDVQYCSTCGSSLLMPTAPLVAHPSRIERTSAPSVAPRTEQTKLPTGVAPTVCPSCGRENDNDAKFCDACGTDLSPEGRGTRCRDCGTLNTSGGEYCERCGAAMSSHDGRSALASPPNEDEESEESVDETLEMNPVKEIWEPVYSRYWKASSLASSGWIGFALFMALSFIFILLVIAYVSGSWWGALCGAAVLFLGATLVLAFAAYSAKLPETEPTTEEPPPEENSE